MKLDLKASEHHPLFQDAGVFRSPEFVGFRPVEDCPEENVVGRFDMSSPFPWLLIRRRGGSEAAVPRRRAAAKASGSCRVALAVLLERPQADESNLALSAGPNVAGTEWFAMMRTTRIPASHAPSRRPIQPGSTFRQALDEELGCRLRGW